MSFVAIRTNWYFFYVAGLLSLIYLTNQLGRYALPLATEQMAQDLHYGEQSCLSWSSTKFGSRNNSANVSSTCSKQRLQETCGRETEDNADTCKWDYNGQGVDYQLLVGPYFILIYTFAGIFIGFTADLYNRMYLLTIAVLVWNGMIVLTSQVTAYWQLALTRFGLGLGVAGCNPFAVSILADTVPANLRAAALGIYNWGIYTGFSLSFAIGNLVVPVLGWRWFFFICGAPGLVLAVLMFLTVKEPTRKAVSNKTTKDFRTLLREGNSFARSLWILLKPLLTPSILILFLAGSIRNAAGYTWGCNVQLFYLTVSEKSADDTRIEIASYLSWVPLVAGSFSVFAGGLLTDRIVRKFGIVARLWVLAWSQLLAAPFAVGALFCPAPLRYLILIPTYIISELWVSVCQAVLVELLPSAVRASGIAIYFFCITNVGGNAPLFVPYFKRVFMEYGFEPTESLRYALCVMYPGLLCLSGIIFALAALQVHCTGTSVRKVSLEFSPQSRNPEELKMLHSATPPKAASDIQYS